MIVKVPFYEYVTKDDRSFHQINGCCNIDNYNYKCKFDATQNIKLFINIDDSLAPTIMEGDYVFFNDDTDFENNKTYVLKINETLIPVKLKKKDDKISIIEKSKYIKGIQYSLENIIGKVIFIHRFNRLD